MSLSCPRRHLLAEEDGMFTDRGYIAYKGYISMEEVMNSGQSNRMMMGGLSQ